MDRAACSSSPPSLRRPAPQLDEPLRLLIAAVIRMHVLGAPLATADLEAVRRCAGRAREMGFKAEQLLIALRAEWDCDPTLRARRDIDRYDRGFVRLMDAVLDAYFAEGSARAD